MLKPQQRFVNLSIYSEFLHLDVMCPELENDSRYITFLEDYVFFYVVLKKTVDVFLMNK